MPSFELSKLQSVTAPRALSDTDMAARRPPTSESDQTGAKPAAQGVSIEVSGSLDTASAPVDDDRVSQIREALKDGRYPLVPTEIADAIIAAQLSFGIER
ncbi:flagellar biosynthesis anti-sigma factor FlgM [Erythrobacter sp. KY5]|uniref:flagellar biosynthesis anti-sigma factor FlgM n=1 Tax=Erythrobacter sp. KY5 TaxID=2011159 RepID=UPI001F3A32B9|nr:flagellar biosynthesis anti-sigma factor FlgM [Erythrobacter sp. KY5]